MKKIITLCCLSFSLMAFSQNGDGVAQSKVNDPKMQWWRDAKFGMFIHWGNDSSSIKKISKGKLYTDGSLNGLKNARSIEKAIVLNTPTDINILERTNGQASWYFLANTGVVQRNIIVSFNEPNQLPELWDAETGNIFVAPLWRKLNDRVEVDLTLSKHKSIFTVFRKAIPLKFNHIVSIVSSSEYDLSVSPKGETLVGAFKPMLGSIHFASGKVEKFEIKKSDTLSLNGNWEIAFIPPVGKIFSVIFQNLTSFSTNAISEIKNFLEQPSIKWTLNYQLSHLANQNVLYLI